jgi:hypothetical protein
VSDTQIIIALAVGASAFSIFCCLILVLVVRLRRVMKSQLETVDSLLSALRVDRGRDTPREPSQ